MPPDCGGKEAFTDFREALCDPRERFNDFKPPN